jgi:regulator of protease activity HflC (stomatin/prohibitin superfamily)
MDNRKFLPFIIVGIIAAAVVIYLSSEIFITIESGERGVIYRRFGGGTDFETIYKPGFHIKAPWNRVIVYPVRESLVDETMSILDKNGLSLSVDVSVRFFPDHQRVPYLHEYFGPDFRNLLVIPEVRSTVRRVMGNFSAEEIYSTKRSEVEKQIQQETKEVLRSENNNIVVQALLIRAINLPEQIKAAIESKLQQEQEALAYQFRLDRERSEAERRRIEAEGIAAYNQILNESLTEKILQQKGIDATLQLSQSNNAKVIIVGSGKDGLPIILGNN